jgi:hypothetical protein
MTLIRKPHKTATSHVAYEPPMCDVSTIASVVQWSADGEQSIDANRRVVSGRRLIARITYEQTMTT